MTKQKFKIPEKMKFGKIINERPEGMSFEDYKIIRKNNSIALKKRIRSFMTIKKK